MNAPPAAFGAAQAQGTINAGRSIGQAGDQLTRIAAEQAQQATETATKNADASLSDKLRTVLYGDGTTANPGFPITPG